jgi:hypothetical protein
MNKQIKELAVQAKFLAEQDINKQISYNTELKAFAEKFAQLIILECADFIDSHEQVDKYGEAMDIVYGEDLIKHFGVEE